MRRTALVILIGLMVVPSAAAAPSLRSEKRRARLVHAQVATINVRLDAVVQRWDGTRVELTSLKASLRANEKVLQVSRANLNAAQTQLEQRLYDEYVNPTPGLLDILVGASSLGDLIDRTETTHAFAAQDLAIAKAAEHLHRTVAHRQRVLRRENQHLAHTIVQLDSQRATITRDLAREHRLLASIHQSITRLTAAAAAREQRRAAAERAEVARRIAAAKAHAATAAITFAQTLTPQPGHDSGPATQPTTNQPAPVTPASPPPLPPIPAVPAAPSGHPDAAAIAARYLGVPYMWGGESPAGFDCSGLVTYVYAQLGISLPHYTVSQWNATIPIPVSELEPGDLVFFDGLGHVGIYIGSGQFIDAPHTGTVVQIESLSGYWAATLDGARRVP